VRWPVHSEQLPADVVAIAAMRRHRKRPDDRQVPRVLEERGMFMRLQIRVLIRDIEIGESFCSGEGAGNSGLESVKLRAHALCDIGKKRIECIVDEIDDTGFDGVPFSGDFGDLEARFEALATLLSRLEGEAAPRRAAG